MAITTQNIITALRNLGIRGKARIEYVSSDRVTVSMDGKYFGLWDCEKKTFVD